MSYNPEDKAIYMWGGEHIPRTAIDSVVWRFKDEKWSELTTAGPAPEPRVAHAQAIIDGVLWIWGGRQGIEMGECDMEDLHKLNLSTLVWEPVTTTGPAPNKRSFHQMCATSGKLHIFGGCSGHDRLADLYTLDLASLVWIQHPKNEAIKGRGGAGFEVDAKSQALFVIGGFCGEECGDCYRFDLATSTWTTVPAPTLRPRSVFGLCTLG